MSPQRITDARIDALISKLERVQADIDKMIVGDTRAADAMRVRSLSMAKHEIGIAKLTIHAARPLKRGSHA